MSRTEHSASVLPPTLLERLEWCVRLMIPLAIGAHFEFKLLSSLSLTDLEAWESFHWREIIQGELKSFNVDIFAENLLSKNIATKAAASLLTLIGSIYMADYFTTARRRGYQILDSPWGKSIRGKIRFWSIFYGLYVFAVVLRFKILLSGKSSISTVFEFTMIGHFIVVLVLLVTNPAFEGFARLLPDIRKRRQEKRKHRQQRAGIRRERRRQAEQEARQRERLLRNKQDELQRLRTAYHELGDEIESLESSNAPDDVIEQQAAELNTERTAIEKDIESIERELSR